jgi:hypothetical protein
MATRSRGHYTWRTQRVVQTTSRRLVEVEVAKRPTIFDMDIQEQIKIYIASQPEPKRGDMQALHLFAFKILPTCKLWFFDGKNSENKTIANPTIGYGNYTIKYANGKTREFFQIGLSANKSGISVHILGVKDKTYLTKTFGKNLGKASVSGYCIRFKALKDINTDILEAVFRYGFDQGRLS